MMRRTASSLTVNLQASAGGIGPEAARWRRRAIATGRWGERCSRRGGKSEGRPGGMPTGLISPRRTPLRAWRCSARAWASSSATAPAARPCQIERDRDLTGQACAHRQSRRPSDYKKTCVPLRARGPSQGCYAGRQSSSVTRNDDFWLDERVGFGEDQVAKHDLPRPCRTLRPAPQAGCFVSRLDVSCESQIALRHRAFGTVALAPSSTLAGTAASRAAAWRPPASSSGPDASLPVAVRGRLWPCCTSWDMESRQIEASYSEEKSPALQARWFTAGTSLLSGCETSLARAMTWRA